jgi:preprotein translocase subunit SecG
LTTGFIMLYWHFQKKHRSKEMYTFALVIFVLVCVLLILIILLQSSRASGMELFGSGNQNIFGGQTSDMLTKITTALAVLFLVGTIGLAVFQSRRTSLLDKELEKMKQTMPEQQSQLTGPTNALLPKTNQ